MRRKGRDVLPSFQLFCSLIFVATKEPYFLGNPSFAGKNGWKGPWKEYLMPTCSFFMTYDFWKVPALISCFLSLCKWYFDVEVELVLCGSGDGDGVYTACMDVEVGSQSSKHMCSGWWALESSCQGVAWCVVAWRVSWDCPWWPSPSDPISVPSIGHLKWPNFIDWGQVLCWLAAYKMDQFEYARLQNLPNTSEVLKEFEPCIFLILYELVSNVITYMMLILPLITINTAWYIELRVNLFYLLFCQKWSVCRDCILLEVKVFGLSIEKSKIGELSALEIGMVSFTHLNYCLYQSDVITPVLCDVWFWWMLKCCLSFLTSLLVKPNVAFLLFNAFLLPPTMLLSFFWSPLFKHSFCLKQNRCKWIEVKKVHLTFPNLSSWEVTCWLLSSLVECVWCIEAAIR